MAFKSRFAFSHYFTYGCHLNYRPSIRNVLANGPRFSRREASEAVGWSGSRGALLPPSPLRTALATFTARGSSRSNAPFTGRAAPEFPRCNFTICVEDHTRVVVPDD